jgi:ferric-dicitrate binding protein FerR (iron transport regulator)
MESRCPNGIEDDIIDFLIAEIDQETTQRLLDKLLTERVHADHNPDEQALRMYGEMAERLGFPREDKRIVLPARNVEVGRKLRSVRMTRYAAVVIFATLSLSIVRLWYDRPADTDPAVYASEIMVTANGGQHKQIVLPDSSSVYLRSGSSISYTDGFKGGSRDVRLSGEAHFTIQKDERPFTVHTDNMQVKVHGTVFNVSDFPDEHTTTVKLYSGAVEANMGGETVMMEPGNLLSYNNETQECSVCEDVSDPASWMSGLLLFENRTMTEIIMACERHFGIEIETAGFNETGLRHSMVFDAGDTIQDIMNVLKILTDDFTYRVEGDIIKIVNTEQ